MSSFFLSFLPDSHYVALTSHLSCSVFHPNPFLFVLSTLVQFSCVCVCVSLWDVFGPKHFFVCCYLCQVCPHVLAQTRPLEPGSQPDALCRHVSRLPGTRQVPSARVLNGGCVL